MTPPFPLGAARRPASPGHSAAVTGSVRWILRAEGVAGLLICSVLYALTDLGWGFFFLLFLAPDLSLLGYLIGPRAGAMAYNLAHSTIGPIVLGTTGFILSLAHIPSLALIWTAHILFDRLLGLGLKYPTGFRYTHLGELRMRARQKRVGP